MTAASPPAAPRPVRAAQALFFLNTAIWLIFGLASLLRLAGSLGLIAVIIAILMFGNAAAMLVCGLGLGTRSRWFYCLGLAVLAVNIALTFTDQFGLLDFLTLAVDLVLLGLLVLSRALYSSGR